MSQTAIDGALQGATDNWYAVYDWEDEFKPSLGDFLAGLGFDPSLGYDSAGHELPASWQIAAALVPPVNYPIPPAEPAPAPGRIMEPDQVAGYLAWLAAGGIGEPAAWIQEDRAIVRAQQAAAAAALAVLATQPPEIRAQFDLGGEGYGSAYTIVQTANPGADQSAILAQATTLQIAADAAGILPSAVITQNPDAAIVNTPIAPGTITGPGPSAGTGATSSSKTILLAALAIGALWLGNKRAA